MSGRRYKSTEIMEGWCEQAKETLGDDERWKGFLLSQEGCRYPGLYIEDG